MGADDDDLVGELGAALLADDVVAGRLLEGVPHREAGAGQAPLDDVEHVEVQDAGHREVAVDLGVVAQEAARDHVAHAALDHDLGLGSVGEEERAVVRAGAAAEEHDLALHLRREVLGLAGLEEEDVGLDAAGRGALAQHDRLALELAPLALVEDLEDAFLVIVRGDDVLLQSCLQPEGAEDPCDVARGLVLAGAARQPRADLDRQVLEVRIRALAAELRLRHYAGSFPLLTHPLGVVRPGMQIRAGNHIICGNGARYPSRSLSI